MDVDRREDQIEPSAAANVAASAEPNLAHAREPSPRPSKRTGRRALAPLALFAATCVSTYWAGAAGFAIYDSEMSLARAVHLLASRWAEGLTYMLAVLAILLAHEFGHFVQAVRYRIPSSWPYFIPMPITHIGTMGAVIVMRGANADRRELFDIGLTGPLAGLAVAVPLICIGLLQADALPNGAWWGLDIPAPLLLAWMGDWLNPGLDLERQLIHNPLLLAGWVGLFVTGLNMLPISQLDGGHVAYTLFGRRADWLARGVLFGSIVGIAWSGQYAWLVMVALVSWIGIHHPPTANDKARLGWVRAALGAAALAIPVLCLAPAPLEQAAGAHVLLGFVCLFLVAPKRGGAKMNATVWILVADASRARLFSTNGKNDAWTLVQEFDHPESRAKAAEINPKKPGRMKQSAGDARPAMEPTTDPKAVEANHFAHELRAVLSQARSKNAFDHLVLVAPPRFLGQLKSELPSPVEKAIFACVDKDYWHSPQRELVERLEDYLPRKKR